MNKLAFICLLLLIIPELINCMNQSDLSQISSKSKLQIGIKLRAKSCQIKSKKGDFLHVHYQGFLEDGSEFDSSMNRSPLTFSLGSGQVIKGWDQGLIGMCEGEKRKLVVPSELAYGKNGVGSVIPPDATLYFDVSLEMIERKNKT